MARVPAVADVFVSLDREEAKGIHMSRLFLALQEVLGKEELRISTLESLLETLITTHSDLSESAEISVRFEHLVEQDSLESGHRGWKSHPILFRSRIERGEFHHEVDLEVTYSSTCPCSAALSRQLASEKFLREFEEGGAPDRAEVARWIASEAGMPATPHSQRSFAELTLALETGSAFDVEHMVEIATVVEQALGTPVQSAVKREDEQAFAALNGANLMFCEDAARNIRASVEPRDEVVDYRIKVRHEESLHPHDAVAILVKDVDGGMRVR